MPFRHAIFKAKKTPPKRWRYWYHGKSDSPLNLVGTEASGTGVHMARSTIDNRLDPLHIGLPSTVGASVRVAHLDAESNTLIAKFALCHLMLHLLA